MVPVVNLMAESMTTLSTIRTTLHGVISSSLDELVTEGDDYALLDFPDYSNVGDSLIWLGALNYLKGRTGKLPSYVCTIWDFNADELRLRSPDGPIFLSGGGNFGNLWPKFQDFRRKVLESFPDRQIVQLPQTIHFTDKSSVAATRDAIAKHGNFRLYVRDRPSLEFAQSEFNCLISSCPDMAFALDPMTVKSAPTHDVALMLRTDKEQSSERGPILNTGLEINAFDWINESRPVYQRYFEKAENRLERYLHIPNKALMYKRRADRRLERGRELLQTGNVVVTDRLHGFIFSTLLGIEHAILDNSYGKLKNFHGLWMSGSDQSVFFDTFKDATDWARIRTGCK